MAGHKDRLLLFLPNRTPADAAALAATSAGYESYCRDTKVSHVISVTPSCAS